MYGIRILKRHDVSSWRFCLILFSAVLFALFLSVLLLALQGKSPLMGIRVLFQGAFSSRWALSDCLIKAIPIYLCAIGVAVAFRLQVWNIGAEGQFAWGAIGATWTALHFAQLPSWGLLPLMMAGAFLCGGLWGLLPAVLKIQTRANEIIVTLMMNYIAILFLDFLVYGPWKDPASFGFPMTPRFPDSGIIGKIPETQINWGMLICIGCGIILHVFSQHTRMGYELRASGENIQAARYARLPYARLVLFVMTASGGLAGWAGCVEASATLNRLQPSIMAGYGYTAIVVAWLARLNPLYIGLSAFFLAALRVGAENLQLELQVSAAFGHIMEGLILLGVLSSGFFIQYRILLRKDRP